jgi:NitT/TauT family transport system permease protein
VFDKLRDGFTGSAANLGSIGSADYLQPTLDTVRTTAIGFGYGSLFGILLGAAMAEWALFNGIVMPYVAGFQAIPKVALAPLFIIWFGFGDFSQEMMATALVFFPVAINTLNGLQGVSADRLEMSRSYGRRRLRAFLHIRLPAAASSIFTGLELGVVYALLGTIAAELVAGNTGIGAVLTSQQATNDIAGIFAMLIVSSVVGGVAFGVIRFIRHRVLFWEGHAS